MSKKEKRITHPIYEDYPEQPYISPDRDLEEWTKYPDKFHYGVIAKQDMVRTEEGLLPGDIITLWRIGFHNFTTETTIPAYLEYRYGVNSDEAIDLLTEKKYIYMCNATDTLPILTAPDVKRILEGEGLPTTGNKEELLARVRENIPEEKLAKLFTVRRYEITDEGEKILKKYDDIIQRHGPKM